MHADLRTPPPSKPLALRGVRPAQSLPPKRNGHGEAETITPGPSPQNASSMRGSMRMRPDGALLAPPENRRRASRRDESAKRPSIRVHESAKRRNGATKPLAVFGQRTTIGDKGVRPKLRSASARAKQQRKLSPTTGGDLKLLHLEFADVGVCDDYECHNVKAAAMCCSKCGALTKATASRQSASLPTSPVSVGGSKALQIWGQTLHLS